MIASSGLLAIETALQIYVAAAHINFSKLLFVILLAQVMAPLIVINFISAIQVTRTQDFSGKKFGRTVCIALHSFQLGLIWRTLKLVILYDSKDWSEFLVLRILHAGFQSIPYGIILATTLLIYDSYDVLRILSIVVSLLSAAVALTSYRLGNTLYESEEFENKTAKVKRIVGVILLVLSTLLLIFCRCSCICLFSAIQLPWIGLIIGSHYAILLLSGIIKVTCKDKINVSKFFKLVYMSYINVFDLTRKGYKGIKCSHVFFYSAILVENIVMSAFWMLTSDLGERLKLMTVFGVLMCFIIGLVIKFCSCGCVFKIEEHLLDDAFNNPMVKVNVDTDVTLLQSETAPNGAISSPKTISKTNSRASSPQTISIGKSPSTMNKSNSNRGSTSTSGKPKSNLSFDNNAFVSSQGNITVTQDKTDMGKSKEVVHKSDSNSKEKPKIYNSNKERLKKGSYGDLASVNSRNTNTLNVSGSNRYFNSFDDPFRERNRLKVNDTSTLDRNSRWEQIRSHAHKLKTIHGTDNRSSLDSSELYPSISSVTSTSISSINFRRRKYQHKPNVRIKNYPSEGNDGYTTDISNSEALSYNDYSMEDSSSWTESSDSDCALTWPPSRTENLLKTYNISDSVSSKENVMHWLDNIDPNMDNSHDLSFPTVNDLSMITDDGTDISMSAMQNFEVKTKKDRKRFKRLLPRPKDVLIKFRSLNYKGKEKDLNERPYPLNQKQKKAYTHDRKKSKELVATGPIISTEPTVQFRANVMHESIV